MNYAKKVFVAFAFLIIFFKAKSFYSNIQVSKKYFLVLDNQLSEKLTNTISEFINQNLTEQKPKEISQKLQEKFPIIKSVVIKRTNPDFLTIDIKIHDPLYKINDDKIFLCDGKLCNKESCSDNFVDLEGIKVKENLDKAELLNELNAFIKRLRQYMLQDFSIEWLNKNQILLIGKLEPNFCILIKYDKIPDQKTIELCQRLYQEYLQTKNKNKKSKKIVFDLRFKEQIIMSET